MMVLVCDADNLKSILVNFLLYIIIMVYSYIQFILSAYSDFSLYEQDDILLKTFRSDRS